MQPTSDSAPHRLYQDVLALLLGTALDGLGLVFYTKAILITGSKAGAALLLALSVVGAVALNLIIALNHQPGRYVGMSLPKRKRPGEKPGRF